MSQFPSSYTGPGLILALFDGSHSYKDLTDKLALLQHDAAAAEPLPPCSHTAILDIALHMLDAAFYPKFTTVSNTALCLFLLVKPKTRVCRL